MDARHQEHIAFLPDHTSDTQLRQPPGHVVKEEGLPYAWTALNGPLREWSHLCKNQIEEVFVAWPNVHARTLQLDTGQCKVCIVGKAQEVIDDLCINKTPSQLLNILGRERPPCRKKERNAESSNLCAK
jgi:hypothetical protein